jgi:hypothetical protein
MLVFRLMVSKSRDGHETGRPQIEAGNPTHGGAA